MSKKEKHTYKRQYNTTRIFNKNLRYIMPINELRSNVLGMVSASTRSCSLGHSTPDASLCETASTQATLWSSPVLYSHTHIQHLQLRRVLSLRAPGAQLPSGSPSAIFPHPFRATEDLCCHIPMMVLLGLCFP